MGGRYHHWNATGITLGFFDWPNAGPHLLGRSARHAICSSFSELKVASFQIRTFGSWGSLGLQTPVLCNYSDLPSNFSKSACWCYYLVGIHWNIDAISHRAHCLPRKASFDKTCSIFQLVSGLERCDTYQRLVYSCRALQINARIQGIAGNCWGLHLPLHGWFLKCMVVSAGTNSVFLSLSLSLSLQIELKSQFVSNSLPGPSSFQHSKLPWSARCWPLWVIDPLHG